MIDKTIDFMCAVPCKLLVWLLGFLEMTIILWIALLPVALSIATGKSWYLMLILTPYAVTYGIQNLYAFETGDEDDARWVSLSNVSDSAHFIIECLLLILLGR